MNQKIQQHQLHHELESPTLQLFFSLCIFFLSKMNELCYEMNKPFMNTTVELISFQSNDTYILWYIFFMNKINGDKKNAFTVRKAIYFCCLKFYEIPQLSLFIIPSNVLSEMFWIQTKKNRIFTNILFLCSMIQFNQLCL